VLNASVTPALTPKRSRQYSRRRTHSTRPPNTLPSRIFGTLPTCRPVRLDYRLMGYAGTCLGIEIRRNPLRMQLDGTGGAAGSPDFNPYVAGLYHLELATHRRLYRLFYLLADHVGMDLSDDPHGLFDTPDNVDRREL
jgi:hypothetical protein